jgi:hypothetical protein
MPGTRVNEQPTPCRSCSGGESYLQKVDGELGLIKMNFYCRELALLGCDRSPRIDSGRSIARANFMSIETAINAQARLSQLILASSQR